MDDATFRALSHRRVYPAELIAGSYYGLLRRGEGYVYGGELVWRTKDGGWLLFEQPDDSLRVVVRGQDFVEDGSDQEGIFVIADATDEIPSQRDRPSTHFVEIAEAIIEERRVIALPEIERALVGPGLTMVVECPHGLFAVRSVSGLEADIATITGRFLNPKDGGIVKRLLTAAEKVCETALCTAPRN